MRQKTLSRAYIVSGGEVVALVKTSLSGGSIVRYSYTYVEDPFTQRKLLANARNGKISRAKKWEVLAYSSYDRDPDHGQSVAHDESEFLIKK